MAPRVVLLELNELVPSLLERFMADGLLPNFRRLHETSIVRVTDAREEPPYLEPWIQWPTVHFGVARAEHGAFHLGDGRRYRGPALGTLLSEAGIRVGIFGSMNLNYERLDGYYVPDPWDAEGRAYPPGLDVFARFVARQVRESSREGARVDAREALGFVRFLVTNGLSRGTIAAVLRQVLAERVHAGVRWKRAMLLDDFSYDTFEALNRRYRVAFASFFSNSVAHFQHYHWRDMAPELFDHPLEPAAVSQRDAIRDGYVRNDAIVGRALRAYPRSTIVFATALSQQPWTDTAKCVYRPHDFARFAAFADLGDVEIVPLMAEQFRIAGGDPAEVALKLGALRRAGEPLVQCDVIEGGVHAGCALFDGDPRHLESIVTGPRSRARFGDLFYRLSAMRSGRHHPLGALWIRDGSPHRVEPDPVALETIAPTILAMFGVAAPSNFSAPLVRERRPAAPV